jgi:hypothetical protein
VRFGVKIVVVQRKGIENMRDDSLKGTSVSGVSTDDDEQVRFSPRFDAIYVCPNGHVTTVTLSTDAEVPPDWNCDECSEIALLRNSDVEAANRDVTRNKPSTTWDKLLERRSEEELERMLNERLRKLESGEIVKVFML